MKNRNKDFKKRSMKKWEFVFPDETPLGICSEFAEVFINNTMERDPNFAGIIVGYPVSLYGEICDDERFGDGRTMILTSHIKSIDRVRRPSWLDRVFIWAWWPRLVGIAFRVTTNSGSTYKIKLRDAGKKVLGLFDVYLCGEPVEVAMVDIDIVVGA